MSLNWLKFLPVKQVLMKILNYKDLHEFKSTMKLKSEQAENLLDLIVPKMQMYHCNSESNHCKCFHLKRFSAKIFAVKNILPRIILL